ncbi:hypothetical protein SY89_02969 [Halolamina pelagica]|uniref:Putative sensor domain-containing protein n=1 Tax=Halolamina pelagica TaxID=699431 RepID=A0A0P7HYB6_9EURY|nr:sensor domain-containing protein [Halolamina pelagica]KPN32205.1 hypothetical protein SY89_02969 [Halolamina pelagica]
MTVPLGFCYFLVLTVAVSTTLGLAVTLAGPIAFGVTLLLVLALSKADLWLTNATLGIDAGSPQFPDTDEGIVDALAGLVLGRDTWVGGLYLLWRSLLGLIAFVLLVGGAGLSFDLLLAPLGYGDALVVNYGYGVVAIDTLPRALGRRPAASAWRSSRCSWRICSAASRQSSPTPRSRTSADAD